jgi:hypothetical protein
MPDPDLRQTTRQELELANDTPMLLYSARLVEQKQPRVLATVLQRLQAQGVRFVALVAGDGPDFKWLQNFVSDKGLAANIKLLGGVDPERMRQLLAAADIFFLPSQWEGIALSVYEAMAAGLPVVAADVGGQRELVTPECGVLVPRGNAQAEVEQYVAALSALLPDAPRRQAMGAAGRRRIQEHFQLDQMGATVQACLQRAQALTLSQPRPVPDLALGRMCAAQAVEYMRLSQLADQLWAERHGLRPAPPASRNWRHELYKGLYRWHEPYYRWYSKRGWTWPTAAREAAKRFLLRQISEASK